VTKLAVDTYVKEWQSSTLYSGWGSSNGIVPDAVRLYNDVQSGFGSIANDMGTFGQDLALEARIINMYCPKATSLSLALSSSQIVSDFNAVVTDLAINDVFATINTYLTLNQVQTSPFNMASSAITSALNQVTSPYSTTSSSTSLPLGNYSNATSMGLACSTGTGGALMNQFFGSALGVNSNTLTTTLTSSGALTPLQINSALSPYLGMSLTSFYSGLGGGGIASLINASGAMGLPS
jgi:hypothetical protein